MSAVPQPDRVGLASVLAEVPGKWVAVDLDTNVLRAVAVSPLELVAEVRSARIGDIGVVWAPEPQEPQLVGLG